MIADKTLPTVTEIKMTREGRKPRHPAVALGGVMTAPRAGHP